MAHSLFAAAGFLVSTLHIGNLWSREMKKMQKILSSALLGLCLATTGALADADNQSTENVYWWWGPSAGTSQLIRTPRGLTATLKTSGLPAGHAMTLWIMFFNNPDECATSPCTLADAGNPAAGFDFHYAGGQIVNSNNTTLSGYLRTGDTGGSGFAEIGIPEASTPLVNPLGADVILAVHSHGPAQSGTALAAQMSSYLGGCMGPFLGTGGFADSAADIPANVGECSTIQRSMHSLSP